MLLLIIGYASILLFLTSIIDPHQRETGKKLVSIFHSFNLFCLVVYCTYYNITRYIGVSIFWSLTYLFIDSFIYPVKRHFSIHFHHILVGLGELVSMYLHLEYIVFYSFLGEIISVFLHLRELTTNRVLKQVWEVLFILSFIPTRIFLPLFWFFYLLLQKDSNLISLLIYGTYVGLNMYWTRVLWIKIVKKMEGRKKNVRFV